jgi:hypothetical protein
LNTNIIFLIGKRQLFLLCLFFISSLVFSQNKISGKLIDEVENIPLPGATVTLSSAKDSTFISGTVTDIKGLFSIDAKSGSYILSFKFIGYSELIIPVSVTSNDKHLGTVKISPASTQLKDFIVEEKEVRAEQKGDTTEYNAKAFKVNKDANVEDLAAKMPGISVEKGTVKAHGEDVKKITVDGKEYCRQTSGVRQA